MPFELIDEPLPTLREAMAEHERQLLLHALSRHDTQAQAAKNLGISRATLQRKLKALGLTQRRRKPTP